MKKLKVAVIGAGMIAQSAHLPAYRYFSDRFSVCAVSDVNEKAAKDAAERFDIPHVYTDAEEMLQKEKPDLVSVCAPNRLHKSMTLAALRNGAHVVCEKPLAFTLHDAKEMFDAAREKGLLLCACQSMRFTPDRLAAKAFLENGNAGTPYYCEFSRIRRRGIPFWGTFHIKEKSGGGALVDIGVHMLDAALWLMGSPEVDRVSGTTARKLHTELGSAKGSGALSGNLQNARAFDPNEMNVEDFASGHITFKNGGSMNFKVAWAANLPDETTIRIAGEKAGILLPEAKIYSGEKDVSDLAVNPDAFAVGAPFSGHFHVLYHFYDSIVNGAPLVIKPEETINSAGILEAFYRSAELSREVSFDKLL